MAVGNMTRQTIAYSDMPSMRAASIRSSGTVMKNCRIKKIPKTEIVHGTMSAA